MESSGEPTRGSRDSSEDFVVVVSSEGQVSFDIMGSTGSDHATTFFCLDRVIVASGGNLSFSFGGDFDPLFIGIEEFRSISEFSFFQPCIFFGSVTLPSDEVGSVFRGATVF